MTDKATTTKSKTIHFPTEGFTLDIEKDHISIRVTDYHAGTLVLFWQELFDLAKGLGLDTPRGGRPQ